MLKLTRIGIKINEKEYYGMMSIACGSYFLLKFAFLNFNLHITHIFSLFYI